MALSRITVSLDPPELVEIERICLDDDASGALEFVQKVLWPEIQTCRKGHCKPAFEFGEQGGKAPPGPPSCTPHA